MSYDPAPINALRTFLRTQILDSPLHCNNLESRNVLLDAFHKTIVNGESDSVIVVGRSGAGKEVIVNDVMSQVSGKYWHAYSSMTVNGDILANDFTNLNGNTSECPAESHMLCAHRTINSASEVYNVIHKVLTLPRHCHKPLVIIINKFERFCSVKTHSLLYSLFELTQTGSVPTLVIGLSTRYDLVDTFEKRIRSRFSHKVIVLMTRNNIEVRMTVVRKLIHYPEVRVTPEISSEMIRKWNSSLDDILLKVKNVNFFKWQLDKSTNENHMKNALYLIVKRATPMKPYIVDDDIKDVFYLLNKDPLVQIIKSLPIVELSLLIAMINHHEIFGSEEMNFDMALAQHRDNVLNSSVVCPPRYVAFKAFERLVETGFLKPVVETNSPIYERVYEMHKLVLTRQQLDAGLCLVEKLPTVIREWAMEKSNQS